MTYRYAYRVSEVAELLGLSSRSVTRMIKAGDLPRVNVGRAVLIPASGIEAFLDGKEPGSSEPGSSSTFDPSKDEHRGSE